MAGKKLLVADDSLTIQKVIRLALSNEGYEIQAVSDGNDAVQQISLFRPDVVLIDVSLPGQSAFEVKRAINELQDLEEVRFVLMSSAFEKVDETQAAEVKFHGRLTKPFDPAHLRQVLTDALAQVTAQRMEPTSLLSRPAAAPKSSPVLEDWLNPISSNDPIVSAPPLSEPIGQLWDNNEEPAIALSGMTPPPMPDSSSVDQDSDIKHLTDSTIRLSGLDDFQWSVNEPSLKSTPALAETGGATFQIEPPSDFPGAVPPFQPELEPSIASLPPLPPTAGAASPSDFYTDSRPASVAPPADVIGISQEQMEEIIHKQLKETFQKMAEKLLPEMAEKIIKQEIHKMLSDL